MDCFLIIIRNKISLTIEVELFIHKQTETKKQNKIKNRIKKHNNNNHSN